MVIKCFGSEIICEKAVKGDDFIKAYNERGVCIFDAAPIVDFSDYVLIDGEWSTPPIEPQEQLRADVDYLLMLQEG